MKKAMKSGFTLIELLVVVAIIAVIGAGVAVTFNRLDERAKSAMEISDIGILSSTIKNWSFLHDNALPNQLDSLIGTDGNLYSQMPAFPGLTGTSNNGTIGLYAQSGYTFYPHQGNSDVISGLASAGLTTVYLHDIDRTVANDSTFDAEDASTVDTSKTAATLNANETTTNARTGAVTGANTSSKANAQAIVDAAEAEAAWDFANGPFVVTLSDGTNASYVDDAAYQNAKTAAQAIADASLTCDTLAFIDPTKGATMGGQPMAMNIAAEIISNIGMTPDQVARCDEDAATAAANGRRYWLVVFGLGRFASIYQGKSVRVDTPVCSKRYNDNDTIYSRYLAVVRVPVSAANGHTGSGEFAQIVAILSPQGLSSARLANTYRDDVAATNN